MRQLRIRRSKIDSAFQSLERRTHLSRTVANAAASVVREYDAANSIHLPRYETDAEKQQATQNGPQTIEVPGPAPTGPIDPVAEYDDMEGLVVSWTGSTAWINNLAQMTRYVTVEAGGRMYIGVTSSTVQASAVTKLTAYEANLDNVTFYTTPMNSIWARDYGPRYVYEGDVRVITDHQYNVNRPLDDHIPANFSLLKQQQIYQMGIGNNPLKHGGGNFHLTTNGDAYMTQLVNNNNPSFTSSQIQQLYRDYQNDDVTITGVFPGSVDGTGHIDMWMQIYDDNKVFISDWPNNPGSTQDNICETTATLMASRGYQVTRIPAYSISGVHYTFANMVIFNNVVMLPQYTNGPGATVSAQALATVQAAFGASKTVYGINANSIITAAGAFHCIVQHIPVPHGAAGANGGLAPTAYVRELEAATYYAGQEIDISWISDDDAVLSQLNGVQSVDVLLSTDGGASFPQILAADRDPLGLFTWTVPSGIDTTTARIKVVATDAVGNTGFDVTDVNFRIVDAQVSITPGKPVLSVTSDTGWSSSDQIINLNNSSIDDVIEFVVPGTTLNAQVKLFAGDLLIGSAISTGGDVVIQTNGNAALVDGNHQITATQIIGSQVESSRSLAQTITIDTVAPIVDYAFSFEHEQRVDIFPNDVVQFSDLIFHNETDNTTLMGNQLSLTSNGVSMSVYKASGLFSNGNWHVSGPGPTDLAGNSPGAIDFDFYVLAGDANRDRVVNFADLLIIAQRYNTSNNGFSQGNFDYSSNGLVDFSDLLIVAQNYNVSVPAALLSAQRQRGALALLEDRAERWLA